MLPTGATLAVLSLVLATTACSAGTDTAAGEGPSATAPAFARTDRATTRLFEDLSSFVHAVRESLETTGAVPASANEGTLADPYYSLRDPRIDYRPSSDLRDFQLCIQAGRKGPWVTYDTARRGVVSVGTKGACAWEPPEPGSVLEARRDQWQILTAEGVEWGYCEDIPPAGKLRDEGLLSKGNRIGCQVDEYQEGDVEVLVFCVQHGDDGPWVSYDQIGLFAHGEGGPCQLDIGQDADAR